MNKIVSIKETSAIFLAIVLVLGTIALTIPSFSVEAQATSDREKDYDKYEYKKSYEKDDYKSEYSSYGKYDRDHDKSEKDSKSVFVKKVKCNNINVNLNGIDVNTGGLPINGPVTDPVAVAQEEDDDEETESNSLENDNESYEGRDGKSDSNTNSKIVCINNNNNIVVEEEEEEPEQDPCVACFEEFLEPDEITTFLELFGGQSIESLCELFTNPENNIVVDEQVFRDALPNVDPEDVDDLIDCLEEEGFIFIQTPPP